MGFAPRAGGSLRLSRLGLVATLVVVAALVLVASPWTAPASCTSTVAAGEPAPMATATTASGDARAPVPTAAASTVPTAARTTAIPDPAALQRAIDADAAAASALDVTQGVAVLDRATGQLVASVDAEKSFNTESVTKLFTAAYYLVESNGSPGTALGSDLRSLVAESNNGVQIDLWQPDIVSSIAERYGLTSSSASGSSESWGSDRTTARDQATLLLAASRDPLVGPQLLSWMALTTAQGGDGFDQRFGFNALTGEHGSKQGWSDPGWSPANLHSVGWTGRYVGAILQNSPTASYATMRATATATALRIAAAG